MTLHLNFVTPLWFSYLSVPAPLGHSPLNLCGTIRNIHQTFLSLLGRDFRYKCLTPLNRLRTEASKIFNSLCHVPPLPIEGKTASNLKGILVFLQICIISVLIPIIGMFQAHVQLFLGRVVRYCPLYAKQTKPACIWFWDPSQNVWY